VSAPHQFSKNLQWMHGKQLRRLHSFPRFLWHRFWDDQCFEAAAALAYTTLLALVPLGAVSLTIISAFPQFQAAKEELLDFLFTQFVPSAGSAVKSYLEPLFTRASALTVPGVIALMVSAVLMMNSIESACNHIWRAPTARPPLQRFVVFWAALTLGPLLLAASLVVSGYLKTLPLVQQAATAVPIGQQLLKFLPGLIAFMGFTLSYIIVPHRAVRWRHALIGGLLATFLFEVAKRAFVWYVATFPATQQVYDALSLLPIFLLWLYILWLIVLLGASLTSSLAAYRFALDQPPVAEEQWLIYALRVLGHLKLALGRGEGLHERDLRERIPGLTDDLLQRFLSDFDQLKLIARTEDGLWVLSRDLNQVTLLDLYRTGHYPLPTAPPERTPGDIWEVQLQKQLAKCADQAHTLMSLPLQQFFVGAAGN
jgi:membrane protein